MLGLLVPVSLLPEDDGGPSTCVGVAAGVEGADRSDIEGIQDVIMICVIHNDGRRGADRCVSCWLCRDSRSLFN